MKWPFGKADVQTVAKATTMNATVANAGMTYLRVTPALTANSTLNLDLDPELQDGAVLMVEFDGGTTPFSLTLDATDTLSKASTPAAANKKRIITCVYQGGRFYQISETPDLG